jgi:hypothetical protein
VTGPRAELAAVEAAAQYALQKMEREAHAASLGGRALAHARFMTDGAVDALVAALDEALARFPAIAAPALGMPFGASLGSAGGAR